MKYYSEKTMKVYDKVEELNTAEKEYDEAHAAEIAKKKEKHVQKKLVMLVKKQLKHKSIIIN